MIAGVTHEGGGDFVSRRHENLLLIAQPRVGWPNTDVLQVAVRELRAAYPAGSAVMNYIVGREGAGAVVAWTRIASVFLTAATNEEPRHLGTVHLVEYDGLWAMPLRLVFRYLERPGGDFARHRNKIVRSVDAAADLLARYLADGPVAWNRDALREAIASFIRDAPLSPQSQEPRAPR